MSRNLLLTGGPGHDFDAIADSIAVLLHDDGVETTIATEPAEVFAALASSGSGSNAPYDMFTVHALRWSMGTERFTHLRDEQAFTLDPRDAALIEGFVTSGGALLALHGAVICFDAQPTWRALCGAAWNWDASSHPPAGVAHISVTGAGRVHPITRGLDDFSLHDEVYGFLDEDPGLTPLLTSTHGDRVQPVLWARDVGRGRVVTDVLGHGPESFEDPTHRTILRRAAAWARRGPAHDA